MGKRNMLAVTILLFFLMDVNCFMNDDERSRGYLQPKREDSAKLDNILGSLKHMYLLEGKPRFGKRFPSSWSPFSKQIYDNAGRIVWLPSSMQTALRWYDGNSEIAEENF